MYNLARRPKIKKPRIIMLGLAIVLVLAVGGRWLSLRHTIARAAAVSTTVSAGSNIKQTAIAKPVPELPSPCTQNSGGKLLVVSIGQQHFWACDGATTAKESAVTTGTSTIINGVDDNTPTGTWHIYSKQTNVHLRGSDANGSWDDLVKYWVPYDGAIGFHDASWQTFPFGSSQYQTNGSHGCIHMPTDIMAWTFSWAPVGTTVTIET